MEIDPTLISITMETLTLRCGLKFKEMQGS